MIAVGVFRYKGRTTLKSALLPFLSGLLLNAAAKAVMHGVDA
jgi:hypothetical protein